MVSNWARLLREDRRAVLVALAVLTVLVYSNSLFNGFVWDDAYVLLNNEAVKDVSNLPQFFADPETGANNPGLAYYRPLRTSLYALVHHFVGSRPFAYHALNVLIHVANVGLVLLVFIALGSGLPAATFVAAVFAVHPIATEAVASVTGLADVLFAFFYLLAFFLHLKYKASAKRAWLSMVGVYLSFAAALLSKELAITLPLIVIASDMSLGDKIERARQGRGYEYYLAGLWFVAGAFLLVRSQLLDGLGGGQYEGVTFLRTMLMQITVVTKYIQLIVLPVGLSVRHTVPIPESYLELNVVLAVLVLLATGLVGVWNAKRNPQITFGIAWFFITLLPVMNIIPLQGSMIGERFCYVPLIGIAYAVAQAVPALQRRARGATSSRAAWVAAVVAVSLLGVLTVRRNADWRDNLSIFESAVKVAPGSNAVREILAREYERLGRTGEARDQLIAATRNTLAYIELYERMGDRAFASGKWREAAAWYERVLRMDAENSHARDRLDAIEVSEGR
jgi:hypothetical protein